MPYQAAKNEDEASSAETLHDEKVSTEADHPQKGADLLLSLTKASRNPIVTPMETATINGCFPSSRSSSSSMGPPVSGNHHRLLYHSPIKVASSASTKGSSSDSSSELAPYSMGRAPAWSPTSFNGMVPVFHTSFGKSPSFSREKEQHASNNATSKRSRAEAEEKKEAEVPEKPGKQRIISPSSSNEKTEDDVSESISSKSNQPHPWGQQPPGQPQQPPMMYPPHWQQPGYPPPPPHMAYPAYAAYPPHFPPPWGMYGPPPPGILYPPPPQQYQMQQQQQPHPEPLAPGNTEPPTDSKPPDAHCDDWQCTTSTANRCVPLKHPVPTRYWANASAIAERRLPDFSRLVNFPDFLSRGRNSEKAGGADGKKNCVMCGKVRVCSASIGRRGVAKPDDNETTHIIPRQNKGVCTVCDVTVWVVLEQEGLEIKWCKGCKNFRPWAAFGEKGLATKCVRCRKRQKEKYATQKSETRSVFEEQKEDDAAKGLRNLMNGSV